jgi:acylglycerol lipase
MRPVIVLALLVTLTACAPQFFPGGERTAAPSIDGQALTTSDSSRLPLRRWPTKDGSVEAVVIALHGFNDYSRAFEGPASWWAKSGLTVYAYDQRGFGEGPHPGHWSSTQTLAADLDDAVRAVQNTHPGKPVFLLGSSMGAAVILSALGSRPGSPQMDETRNSIKGVILVGPAVWGHSTMNPLLRFLMWLGAHTVPANHLTGEGFRVKPSDNTPMLRALGRDPLIIKSTRTDTLYGLVQLMGEALDGARHLTHPALVLAAADDQLIPGHAHQELLGALRNERTEATYPNGFHMLLRDLQAKIVWQDVLSWIRDRNTPLPSGLGRKIKSGKATVR